MGTLVDQLPALIGVVVGTVGTVLATAVSDRTRWRHDRDARWEEKRMDAYSRYAVALKDIHNLSYRVTSASDPLDRQRALSRLADADVVRTREWEAVLLVGDGATLRAAREWREAIRRVSEIAFDGGRDDADWAPRLHEANRARDSFYLAARQSLSLPGAEVAQADWLSRRPEDRT